MHITEEKANMHIKSQSEGFTTEPAHWTARFYYTKRTADILKAIAEKKAEKEAERVRIQ